LLWQKCERDGLFVCPIHIDIDEEVADVDPNIKNGGAMEKGLDNCASSITLTAIY
jgi:hypothetical protein